MGSTGSILKGAPELIVAKFTGIQPLPVTPRAEPVVEVVRFCTYLAPHPELVTVEEACA